MVSCFILLIIHEREVIKLLVRSLMTLLLAVLRVLLLPLKLLALPATVLEIVDMALAYIYDIIPKYSHFNI